MTATDDCPARQPIGIVSVTATGETSEGQVEVRVQLANAPSAGGENAWLHSRLARRVMAVLQLRSIGSSPDGSLHVVIPAEQFEQGMRAIRQAVSDFNEASDASLLGEDRRDAQRLRKPPRGSGWFRTRR